MLGLLFRSLRPQQWTKNAFLLIPLIFSQKLAHPQSLLLTLQALLVFCALTGGVYLLNDLLDLEADRSHPEKRHRPIASGRLSPRTAVGAAIVLLGAALWWGARCGMPFLVVLLSYLAVQALYNLRLKEVVILDIFCISAGFFLRVVAGGAVLSVKLSHWLIICTVLVSMFLALGKRRHERVSLGEEGAPAHRKVLTFYSPRLLDQMIGLITAGILITYMLYCIAPETVAKFHTDHLLITVPFVLYGVFRYLYLIHVKQEGGAPERLLLSDPPLLSSVLLWALCVVGVIYGPL